jgi:mRNA interferase MazF
VNPPARGQVYWADLGSGRKPWLVVSENGRNRKLDTVLAVRITTTLKTAYLPSHVLLPEGEPVSGVVRCDDIEQLAVDELVALVGALGRRTMSEVNEALRVALALPDFARD